MTEKPDTPTPPINSTMASRKAERVACAAAEGPTPRRHRGGFRAGIDAENPVLVVTHVQA